MRSAGPDVLRTRLPRRVAGIALTALIAGCSLFATPRKPPDPLPGPTGAIRPLPAWSLSLGAPSGVGFVPVAFGDSVWAAARDGTVMRIDLASGRIGWRASAGKPLTAGVGTDGTVTVVAARDGTLIALDAQGAVAWTVPIGAEVVTPPAVADGVVLLRTSDNRVLAFEAKSGRRLWTFQRQNPPLVLRNSGGLAIVPGFGFVGMPGGRMVLLGLSNGAPRWDVLDAPPRGANEPERISDVVGSPLVIGREVCAVTYQGRIGCLDTATGNPVWTREFSSAAGLDVDERGVVAPDADDTVHALDRRGEPQWQQKAFARRRLSAPLIVGGTVALGDLAGNVLWLSRSDGALGAVSRTDGTPIVAPPAATGQTLVVQTSGGGLHAFRVD